MGVDLNLVLPASMTDERKRALLGAFIAPLRAEVTRWDLERGKFA